MAIVLFKVNRQYGNHKFVCGNRHINHEELNFTSYITLINAEIIIIINADVMKNANQIKSGWR